MTSCPERVAMVFEPGAGRTRVRISGEIDMDGVTDVRENLTAALEASREGLDIDLTAVTFCGSAGLHVLLELNGLALDAEKSLVLTSLSDPVARLLRLSDTPCALTVHARPASTRPTFQVHARRYGPTVHLAPVGELDADTRSALDEIQAALEGADVVACDMRDLTFLDVVGLHALLDFVRRMDVRGAAFFSYDWQRQPRRLLDLVDESYPSAGDPRARPARLLRRLRDGAAAARTSGAARARRQVPRRTVFPLR
ncbi:STAS domain-containing protein [Streptomyces zaomyceticus]|uniref:STAS domain-containing protein n=1 Tax=Streptomyces zaomyceticus TaxID=68286 RepID=UPI0034338B2D